MKFNLYAKYIMGDYQCGFRCNRSAVDCIFCVFQINRKSGNTVKLCISFFIDFKKASDSVRMEVLYDILVGYGNPMKLVGLKNMSD
jgi:hypothetical protein